MEAFWKDLNPAWKKDQFWQLADPAPWNADELKAVVDVGDPRSVAAYFVWAVVRLTDDFEGGMDMMKYLYADIEPFSRDYAEGGKSGRAGWDSYFNERLKSADYRWLPRAYFDGASADNGFSPSRPLGLSLFYNATNTDVLNGQSAAQLGRLNVVYYVQSNAAGNKVNITVSRFDGSDRWYVTSGTSSSSLFYDQRAAVNRRTRELLERTPNDGSTAEEHRARYAASAAPTAPASGVGGSWTCACGAVSSGRFCPDCGRPKPAADGPWICACGAENKGKFCTSCGKPRL